MKKRIAVLVSGGGTNLQALLDAEAAGKIPHGEIALVISNNPNAYALERAKLAGVPGEVVKRAKEILAQIEKVGTVAPKENSVAQQSAQVDMFASIIASKDSEAADRIRATDINTMTPIEAMNLLFELKKMLN